MTMPSQIAPARASAAPVRRRSAVWQDVWSFLFDPGAFVGLILLTVIVLGAVLAPWIMPQNPYDIAALSIMDARMAPGETSLDGMLFLLGSDGQGRDMLSAIFYGLRISIFVGVTSTIVASMLGALVGLVAAYFGGAIDAILMRTVDIFLSFPPILIALVVVVSLGNGVDKVILSLVIVQWAMYARTLRSSAISERNKEYVDAARCRGLSQMRIMFRHILPNGLSPLIVVMTVQVASAITLEATLSFLGVGLPVTEPSLGLLVSKGFEYMISGQYWISTFPGVALLLTVLAINLVGDRLRDVLNPRLKK